MMALVPLKTVLLVIGLVPLVWSAILWGLLSFTRKGAVPDDASEKSVLGLMLAPVVIGLALTVFLTLAPVRLPDMPAFFPVVAAPSSGSVADALQPVKPAVDIMAWLLVSALGVYGVGVLWKVMHLILAFVRLQRVVATASLSQVADEAVFVTQAEVPPFAWGRAAIIIPESLIASLNPEHLRMIVLHERTHLHRGDPMWFALLGWVDALLWFNPIIRRQTLRCRMAAEIACDAAVTRAAPDMREAYARILVQTLKHTAGDVRQYAPAVFSTDKSGDYSMRITEIMHAKAQRRKLGQKWLYAMAGAAVLPVVFAQLAWSQALTAVPSGRDMTHEIPVFVSADGVVSAIDTAREPLESTGVNMLFQTVQVDNGDGVVTNYGIRGGTALKVGDRVKVKQLVSRAGSPETLFIPLKDIPLGTGIPGVQGNLTCLPNLKNICQVEGDTLHGFYGSAQFVATGQAALHYKGRIIHADVIFSDPKGETAWAEGHISITRDDTGISQAS